MASRTFDEDRHAFIVIDRPRRLDGVWPIAHRATNPNNGKDFVWALVPNSIYESLVLAGVEVTIVTDGRSVTNMPGPDGTCLVSLPEEWCVFQTTDEAMALYEPRLPRSAKKH